MIAVEPQVRLTSGRITGRTWLAFGSTWQDAAQPDAATISRPAVPSRAQNGLAELCVSLMKEMQHWTPQKSLRSENKATHKSFLGSLWIMDILDGKTR